MVCKLIAGGFAIAALLPAPLAAQADSRIAMYSNGHYRGAQRILVGPSQLPAPFVVKSVTLPPGTAWQFCSGESFSGCRQISQSTPAMVMTVRSARPIAAVLAATAGSTAGVVADGRSLRGLASEYFVAPAEGGARIRVPEGTAEAASRRAAEFCRAHGWRASAYQRLQSVGDAFYLADLLCADS